MKNKILILILFSLVLFFLSLGARSLWDPDEPRYAEAARVMIETGDYVTPYFNGAVRFDKPPLFYWLVTAAYKVFGINEFAARFFPALLAFAGVILVYLLGKTLLDQKTGLLSGFILATSFEYLVLANASNTDMTFSFFVGLCMALFLVGYRRGQSIWYVLSFISMALAVLTKGPAGAALCILTIGIFLIFTKELKLVFKPAIILGACLFLLIAAPWYVAISKIRGGDYSQTFFIYHNISRFVSDKFHHQEPFYYFIYILAIGFLPWAVFLPNALFGLFRNKKAALKEGRKEWLFILLWFFVPFLFFSASKAKLPTYVLPCFMPLALIVGRFWKEKLFDRFSWFFILLVVIVGVGGALPVEKIIPGLSVRRSSRQVSAEVGKVIKPHERLGSFGIFKPSMVFYSHHQVELFGEENIIQFLNSKGRVYCIFKKEDLQKLKDKAGMPLYVVAENERLVAVTNKSGF